MTSPSEFKNFSPEEFTRYARHFAVEKIGLAGQSKIKSSSVLLIGAGGIGSPAALYLAAAGIGKLGLLDDDQVDLSNLQRQILYTTQDIASSKAKTAAKHLALQNPNIEVIPHPFRLTESNAHDILKNYEFILDGSDNYPTRYLVNDVCADLKTPLISASIFQFSGQIGLYNLNQNNNTPCFRCVYPEAPPESLIPNCATAGVLGVVPGILATLAVSELLKIILNLGEISPRLITFDALKTQLESFKIQPSPTCDICAKHKSFSELSRFGDIFSDSAGHSGQICSAFNRNTAENLKNLRVSSLSPHELFQWQNDPSKKFILLDVREEWERLINVINPSFHYPLGQLLEINTQDEIQKILNLKLNSPLSSQTPPVIITYCKFGGRSAKAAEHLSGLGLNNIYNLEGGISAVGQHTSSVPR